MIHEFKRGSTSEPNTAPQLVPIQDAARYLAVSVSTLYGWVWQRKIAFVKVGRALRFDLADLKRFIEVNRTQPRSGGIA